MRKTLLIAGAIGALLTVSACADSGGYGYYGAEVGTPDVYYDGFYGAYPDGYWGPDDFFYYRSGGHFIRDENHHFQHRMFNGAHGYHAHMRAPAGDRDHR